MLIVKVVVVNILLLIKVESINGSDDELEEIYYRGLSMTWRRLLPIKSNEISLQIILIVALSDQSISLCDSHQSKQFEIPSQDGIKCLQSWDDCSSWTNSILIFQCDSKVSEYPKSVLSTEILVQVSSDSISKKDISYKLEYSSLNNLSNWEDLNSPVRLISYFNLFEIDKLNSPPISRFPSHISLDTNKFKEYSLEVFDPDGDLFECLLLSPIDFIVVDSKCVITMKTSTTITVERALLVIEIVEYVNEQKTNIRSRSPYHVIVIISESEDEISCSQSPLISLLNIENGEIHVDMNEFTGIHLKSMSQCENEIDECSIMSASQWKMKSQIEQTNIVNNQKEIEYEFEWISKTSLFCGHQIHCIRCLDNDDNFIDKCINIFTSGTICQNVNEDKHLCSWSSFTSWSKLNQTTYKRQRTCFPTANPSKNCFFCFGSSFQYQSSLAFIKDFQLFEEYLINPKRAHSTIQIIVIASIISLLLLLLSVVVSFYFTFKSDRKKSMNN